MKILAVDTSSKICSVCILENCEKNRNFNVLIEKHNDDEKTHSQKLMPLIKQCFDELNLILENIDLIACCIGPGSFTGIRIGVSTIKAFADVKHIPVVGITSLESLAYNISTPGYIVSLIDAKNNNVYFSLHKLDNLGNYTLFENYLAADITSVIQLLSNYKDSICFVGDGSIVHKNLICENFNNCTFAKQNENIQTSISIAKAGFAKHQLGLSGNSSTLTPIYLKKSQAERVLNGEE